MINIVDCTEREFENKIKTEKIICFGGGNGFFELCDKYHFENRVLYVVDNFKGGSCLHCNEYEIPVRSVNEMGAEIKSSLLILTSLIYIDEMIKQLDDMEECDQLPFYVPSLFPAKHENGEISTGKPMIIPKTIHYCWFGKAEMPDRFQKNIETWKTCCPDYEIICWNEKNYDVMKNRYMGQAYEKGRWGFVPDYARLDIVNQYGGVYLDTDVELLKPLDDLLQFPLFCGFEDRKHVNFGLGFGAVKENPILSNMMNQYETICFINADRSINLTPSPVYQTAVLTNYGLKQGGYTQINGHFAALSPEYLSPISAYGIGNPTAKSYSIHQYAATWFDEREQMIKNRAVENCRLVLSRMEKACH